MALSPQELQERNLRQIHEVELKIDDLLAKNIFVYREKRQAGFLTRIFTVAVADVTYLSMYQRAILIEKYESLGWSIKIVADAITLSFTEYDEDKETEE